MGMARIEWTGRFRICVAVALVAGTAWLAERISTSVTPAAIGSACLYFCGGLLLATTSRSERFAKFGFVLIAFSSPWIVAIACALFVYALSI
jgi:thiol:disulfide interchange protein